MTYLWFIFALLSAVTAALVAIFGKIGLQGIDSTVATSVRSIIMAIFLFLVIFFQKKVHLVSTLFQHKKTITFIILSGIAGALSWLFYFVALKYGKVQQVAPIDRLSVVFAIVFALIFLGEKLSWISGSGIVLITAGAIMVALG